MGNPARYIIFFAIVVGLFSAAIGSIDEPDGDTTGMNFPYGRGLDSGLQLARLLLVPQRMCHPKRNSELINSLLGLPKNMNNVGK